MADQPVYRAAEKYDHAYEAYARLSRDHVALRRRYADLCRAVVLLADDTMLRAQWAASVSEPGDAEVIAGIARRMLALVPDTPPDRPASADQSSTDGQQDSTETQEGTDG